MRTHLASLRALLLFTVILGICYPLAVLAVAQLPGLRSRADGSTFAHGSTLIGQNFTDSKGNPLPQYLQPRPSAAGTDGYDPTSSSASNLGPESIVDTLANPSDKNSSATLSLLSLVCSRSQAIGQEFGVDGSRPYCADGVGSVLAVFWSEPNYKGSVVRVVSLNQVAPATPFISSYHGVSVQDAVYGQDYSSAQVVPVRGDAPADPAVPADAVTASGSGLDPDISPAYAAIQVAAIAKARHIDVAQVKAVISAHTSGRTLGFLGASTVNVVEVNRELDQRYPLG